MVDQRYFNSVDVAFTSVLSALWIVLHLTFGPLGFKLFHLPIFCDVSAYFTLLLAVWVSGKFGVASFTGAVGSIFVLLLRGGAFHILGFAASAVFFDLLFLATKHKTLAKPATIAATIIITTVSAYVAGAVIGLVFMGGALQWALTYWAGLHAVGGLLSGFITLPVIGALEKANVRRLINV